MDSVYLETTVLSYLVARPSAVPLIAARQEITKAWWERRRETFACYISEVVLEEAAQGDAAQAALRLEAVAGMPRLAASPDAERLADGFLQSALPARAALDAAHLANCRHGRHKISPDVELRASGQCSNPRPP
jgi:hypothetical protein